MISGFANALEHRVVEELQSKSFMTNIHPDIVIHEATPGNLASYQGGCVRAQEDRMMMGREDIWIQNLNYNHGSYTSSPILKQTTYTL